MSGKIAGFFREHIFGLSIITMIIGLLVLFIGALGIWFADVAQDFLNLTEEVIVWCPYVLILGLILFGAGLYYLYSYEMLFSTLISP